MRCLGKSWKIRGEKSIKHVYHMPLSKNLTPYHHNQSFSQNFAHTNQVRMLGLRLGCGGKMGFRTYDALSVRNQSTLKNK